jgi:hypothetical protein
VAIDFQHHHFPGGLSFLSFCLLWAGSCRAVFLSKCSRHVVQGVGAVKLVLEEGFFDATCPKIQEEEEACLSCQDVVLNLLSFPQMGARNWVILSRKAQSLNLLFCSLLYAGSHRSHPKRRVLHTVLTLLEASPPLNARNFSEA